MQWKSKQVHTGPPNEQLRIRGKTGIVCATSAFAPLQVGYLTSKYLEYREEQASPRARSATWQSLAVRLHVPSPPLLF
eukprot:1616736-Pyramimonas_sp.AAC.1